MCEAIEAGAGQPYALLVAELAKEHDPLAIAAAATQLASEASGGGRDEPAGTESPSDGRPIEDGVARLLPRRRAAAGDTPAGRRWLFHRRGGDPRVRHRPIDLWGAIIPNRSYPDSDHSGSNIVALQRHLRLVLREYVAHYNHVRPHQALELWAPDDGGHGHRPGARARSWVGRSWAGCITSTSVSPRDIRADDIFW